MPTNRQTAPPRRQLSLDQHVTRCGVTLPPPPPPPPQALRARRAPTTRTTCTTQHMLSYGTRPQETSTGGTTCLFKSSRFTRSRMLSIDRKYSPVNMCGPVTCVVSDARAIVEVSQSSFLRAIPDVCTCYGMRSESRTSNSGGFTIFVSASNPRCVHMLWYA